MSCSNPTDRTPSPSESLTLITQDVKDAALELGADIAGIAPSAPVDARDLYMSWLSMGYEGDMDYMRKYTDIRFDPEALLAGARSVIVIGVNYSPQREDRELSGQPYKVARYAWGQDYHRLLRRILRQLRSRLKRIDPTLRGRICVDTAPFPDKYWAARAGIGWQGKHTNLVSREYGSWLLLGSLVITSEVDVYDTPHTDYCGSCTDCLSACPTGAFPDPYLLDATRCISYWTIESKRPELPPDVAEKLDGWVFGCDICLDVCPWNKFETEHDTASFNRSEALGLFEEGGVVALGESGFSRVVEGTPLGRPGYAGIARNFQAAGDGSNGCSEGVSS